MATPSPAERQELLTDIGRRLDHLPIGPMHLKVVVAIGLGLFFEVYEIFLSSTIATALKTQYGLGGRALELCLPRRFWACSSARRCSVVSPTGSGARIGSFWTLSRGDRGRDI